MAMLAAPTAIPPYPKMAAIIASMINSIGHFNILLSFWFPTLDFPNAFQTISWKMAMKIIDVLLKLNAIRYVKSEIRH